MPTQTCSSVHIVIVWVRVVLKRTRKRTQCCWWVTFEQPERRVSFVCLRSVSVLFMSWISCNSKIRFHLLTNSLVIISLVDSRRNLIDNSTTSCCRSRWGLDSPTNKQTFWCERWIIIKCYLNNIISFKMTVEESDRLCCTRFVCIYWNIFLSIETQVQSQQGFSYWQHNCIRCRGPVTGSITSRLLSLAGSI